MIADMSIQFAQMSVNVIFDNSTNILTKISLHIANHQAKAEDLFKKKGTAMILSCEISIRITGAVGTCVLTNTTGVRKEDRRTELRKPYDMTLR